MSAPEFADIWGQPDETTPHPHCYTPTEVRWRRVRGGDVIVQAPAEEGGEPELWAVGSVSYWAGKWTVTATFRGRHESVDIDPDDYVAILMDNVTRAALELLDDGLGPVRLLDALTGLDL